jgi:hypothetical protein
MKTKIIGICICMLLIATAVPAVTSVKINAINASAPSYPLTSMAGFWNQRQKLLPSDGAAGNDFGISTALSGDTAIIGGDDSGVGTGSAYVFTYTGNTWTQQAKLLASDGQAGDIFGGTMIALDGDTAIIGAAYTDNHKGSAYVFTRTGNTWTQQAKLTASDGFHGALFGIGIALSGDTALIGTTRDDDNGNFSGSAYVFTRTGSSWTEQQKLLASDGAAQDRFGQCVSISGDTAVIGAVNDDNGKGSAYVFTRSGTTWTQQQKLLASDGATGDYFGNHLSIDGNTTVIGAPAHKNNGQSSGAAFVFTRTGTTWTQQAELLASDGASGDLFSDWAVSLEGDTALIGAYGNSDMGANTGSAYVFTRTGSSWTEQQKLLASDRHDHEYFGNSVALSMGTALIGAPGDTVNGAFSGSAYMFMRSDLTFSITGGLGVNLKITNSGTANVTDVPWQIHVEGGILKMINKTVNGTIDIPAGKSVTVKTGMLLGFGAISITAKVADEEQTATGTQLIIFSMVKK